jgi:hypothetical protein
MAMKKPMPKKAKPIVEKATGEKYKSAAAMAKHEKTEPKSQRVKEYGKAGAKKGMK